MAAVHESVGPKPAYLGAVDDREQALCGWLQVARNPFFCFEQALIALCVSQEFLAFRSRLMFLRRLQFSRDRLF